MQSRACDTVLKCASFSKSVSESLILCETLFVVCLLFTDVDGALCLPQHSRMLCSALGDDGKEKKPACLCVSVISCFSWTFLNPGVMQGRPGREER